MFSLKTPAKINWSLSVGDRRSDGYHTITSLTHCVDLYDRISFDHSDSLEVFSDLEIPAEDNLVYRAAVALQSYSETNRGARMLIHKEIPVGAGLGGGSSDAACALVGLNRLWRLDLGLPELSQVGQRIGSDVPLFLHGPLCLLQGRGEIVTPLETMEPFVLLLVKPPWSIPTGWAYGELARMRETDRGHSLTSGEDRDNNIRLLYGALRERDMDALASLCRNDFERVVSEAYGDLAEIKQLLRSRGAALSLMTGSGSAVFGVFKNRTEASEASRLLNPLWNRVVETLR